MNEKLDLMADKPWLTPYQENKPRKVIPAELAEYIRKGLHYYFVNSSVTDKPFIYVYNKEKGVYQNISENQFKSFIKSFIPYTLVKMKDVAEVFSNIQTDNEKIIDEDLFNSDEKIINFEDGILDITTMELKSHSPNVLSTIQIPAKYEDIKNSATSAPTFEKYMLHLVDGDMEKYDIIMQYMGLCISNIYGFRTKKVLFLVGEGNTGKSQIKKLIENILGNENISTTDLKQLNERFGTSSIYQKRLVGCNDMSYQRISDMSLFKSLTGGDKIMFEFKSKTSFPALFKGAFWFNCNELPLFGGDKGEWVYERILPINCGHAVPEEERDPHLFEKLWEEKNTIIRMALYYLQILIKNNFKFKIPKDSTGKLDEYKTRNNTLLSFIEECCEINIEGTIYGRTRKSDFKKVYYKWCDINNNGKGKLKAKEIEEILEGKFKENYGLSNGYKVLNNIKIIQEEAEALGVYLN